MGTRKLRMTGMNSHESHEDEVTIAFSRPLSKLEFKGLELMLENLINESNRK